MLYEAMMVPCVLMEKVRVSDGLGGWTTTWTEGASLNAAILKNSTLQAAIAEKDGFEEVYTITVDRNIDVDFHDVIKRVSDGQCFQITSKPKDNRSPEFSVINFGQFTARAWDLL